jgi:predicted DsbA family dithiol-disulfide isomerase
MLEAVFRAYFLDGRDIGSKEVLVELAQESGIDAEAAARYLDSENDIETVLSEDRIARRLGITGVPCFVFNGRFALSGAQEPEALFQLFDLAREDDQVQRQMVAEA